MRFNLQELNRLILKRQVNLAREYSIALIRELRERKCRKLETDLEHNKVCPKCRIINEFLGEVKK